METITIKQVHNDLQEIKLEIRRLTHFIQEDFELSPSVKKELKDSRKEPLSSYIKHDEVLKEFSE